MAKKATVIILNYNGAKVITAAIDSVLASQTKYPFELIVVDNASTDTSPKLLRRLAKKHHFKTIFSPDNLGFAGGNNLGIKQSESEYVVLLNNDCVVDKHWLDELIACADRHPQAFSVASKICLYPHYFPVTWGIDPQVKVEQIQVVTSALNRFQPTGHQVSVPFMQDNVEAKLHFELPFDSQEDQQLMLAVTVGVPVDNQGNPLIAAWESIFSPENKKSVQQPQLISQQPGRGGRLQLTYQVTVNISQAAKKSAYRLLQNAGTLVFPNGYGRDIGASVYDSKQFYERDEGQFARERAVYATCGAAVLYRRELLTRFGNLDDSFFMYYEDMALAEQAVINGFSNYYCPTATVLHLHALSSGEGSPFFTFHSEKGRLLHLYYNYPSRVFAQQLAIFIFKSFLKLARGIIRPHRWTVDSQHLKIVGDFIIHAAKHFRHKRERYHYPEGKVEANYQQIIQGKWYFN